MASILIGDNEMKMIQMYHLLYVDEGSVTMMTVDDYDTICIVPHRHLWRYPFHPLAAAAVIITSSSSASLRSFCYCSSSPGGGKTKSNHNGGSSGGNSTHSQQQQLNQRERMKDAREFYFFVDDRNCIK